MLPIRPNFLPAQAPPSAHSRIVDFSTTIPLYQHHFAAVIDDFMTEDECKELLALAEEHSLKQGGTWERAMVNVGGGRQAMATEVRSCGRIILDSRELADRLLARLRPYFAEWDMLRLERNSRLAVTGLDGRRNEFTLTRLNERLRFLKYVGGEYFRPHWDGMYTTPDGSEVSLYTIHLYLNGDGEQDLEEVLKHQKREDEGHDVENPDPEGKLLGGATSFIFSFEEPDEAVRIWPKTGSILVFQHNDLLHSGDSVFAGTKYTMRTDVMFSKSPKE